MRIGLTGSMAAGKSTVSLILRRLGFFIIDADELSHEVLHLPAVIFDLTAAFGEGILDKSGNIERNSLAKAAFSSKKATERLNFIVHPRVFERMLDLAAKAEAEGREHIVFDVPLLFETGFEKHCDRVICVIACDELRYERIMLRDGLSRNEASARLARQMEQAEKAARSDAVIENDGGLFELEGNVLSALASVGVFDLEQPAGTSELECYYQGALDE